MPISFKSLGSSAKIQKTVIIKSTQSWTAPADVTSIELTMCSGGGAGQVETGGGGSVDFDVLTVVPSTAYTVTIGAGGAKGASPTNGSVSSFGALFAVQQGYAGGRPGARGGAGGRKLDKVTTQWGGTDGGGISTVSFAQPGYNGLGGGGGASGSYWTQSANSAQTAGFYGASGGGYGGTPQLSWNGSSFVLGVGTPAENGLANSGGGGGAGYATSTSTYGGNGGSGIAIIKYWSAL
jgi:hypothetical protein